MWVTQISIYQNLWHKSKTKLILYFKIIKVTTFIKAEINKVYSLLKGTKNILPILFVLIEFLTSMSPLQELEVWWFV